VQEEYDAIPPMYSQELRNLVVTMLLKDDKARPTTGNILDMPFVEKYMKEFISARGASVKRKTVGEFAERAEATAAMHQMPKIVKKTGQEEKKDKKPLTAKEKLQLRKVS
jgi:hypothetical protein